MKVDPLRLVLVSPPTTFYSATPQAVMEDPDMRGAGVYQVVPLEGEPHISWSHHLPRRVGRLLRTFGNSISHIDVWRAPSRLDVLLILYAVTRGCYPDDYARRLRLPLPWFVRLSESDPFPQLLTGNRLPASSRDVVLGPFANRDTAQLFQEKTEALFQLRRCVGKLVPAPDHPGCIYGEMGQCLRPCQEAVTMDEYASEAARAREFLLTDGRRALTKLSLARDQASADLDFETAAQAHRRLEKVKEAVAARDTVVKEARRFSGVALTPGAAAGSCRLRPMQDGCWQEAVTFEFSQRSEQATSLDVQVRQQLERVLAAPESAAAPAEHLALFSRWYRSTWRDGEWFPYRTLEDLNYRKLVRHMSKMQSEQPMAGA